MKSLGFPIIAALLLAFAQVYLTSTRCPGAPSESRADPSSGESAREQEEIYEGKSLSEWAACLQQEDEDVRRKAARALVAIGEPAYETLYGALFHSLDGTAEPAIKAMVEIGEDAVPALLGAIRMEKSGDLRHNGAVTALIEMGPAAFPALEKALQDDNRHVRLSAVVALRMQGFAGRAHESAGPALAGVLQRDNDPEVRAEAANALGFFRRLDESGVSALSKALKDSNELVRVAAASALAMSRGWAGHADSVAKACVQALIEGLNSRDKRISHEAAFALMLLGPAAESAIPALSAAVKRSEGASLAIDALHALEAIGDVAIPALLQAMEGESRDVRIQAAGALGRLGFSGKISPDRWLADLRSLDPEVRSAAAFVLQNTVPDDPKIIPALIGLLEDTEAYVRQSGADALAVYGPRAKDAVPDLMRMLSQDESSTSAAARALGAIGPAAEAAIPALGRVLSLRPNNGAGYALARIGKAGLPALISVLKDQRTEARQEAVCALSLFTPEDDAAVTGLIAALDDRSEIVRNFAAQGIGMMGPDAKAAVPALIARLSDPDEAVRSWTAVALGRIGEGAKEAIPALGSALEKAGPEEGSEFVIALFQLGAYRQAMPGLLTMAKRRDGYFQLESLFLLGRMEESAGKAIRDLGMIMGDPEYDEAVRLASAYALAKIDPENAGAISFLRTRVTDEELYIRLSACAGLQELGRADADVRTALQRMLKSHDRGIAISAATVLAKIEPEGDQVSVSLLRDELKNRDRYLRFRAASGLAELGCAETEVIGVLTAELRSRTSSGSTVDRSARLLGRLGPKAKDAVSSLSEVLEQETGEVRLEARIALRKIRGDLPVSYEDPASTDTLFFDLLERLKARTSPARGAD